MDEAVAHRQDRPDDAGDQEPFAHADGIEKSSRADQSNGVTGGEGHSDVAEVDGVPSVYPAERVAVEDGDDIAVNIDQNDRAEEDGADDPSHPAHGRDFCRLMFNAI